MSTTNPAWPLPEPDAIGPLVGADAARDAIKATIELWTPFYLANVSARLLAAGKIGTKTSPVKSPQLATWGTWRNEPNFRSLGTGQPAAFLVTVAGTVGKPKIQATGLVLATYRAHVTVQVFGTTWQEALDLASWYETVARACVMQHRSLGGVTAAPTYWVGSNYAVEEHTATRSVAKATLGFDVTLPDIINVLRGPSVPPATPTPGQDETVDEVVVDLTRVPITEPL